MNDGQARSARITRRTFGAVGLALAGVAAVRFWPEDPLTALAKHPDAAALKALGQLPAVMGEADAASRLAAKLDGADYDTARAADALAGRMLMLDGWQVPETTVLAAAWLARQG